MRGLRRTEKFKTDKPSNLNRSESDGEPAKPKGRPGRTGQPLRGEPDAGERKNRELSTRAGRSAWKQARRKGKAGKRERNGSTEGTTAGGDREAGKSGGRKLSSQKGTEADERKRRGTEKAEGESVRQAPGKQLRERNWEGRKETSREAKYQKRTGSTGNRAEGQRKAREAKAERAAPGKQL